MSTQADYSPEEWDMLTEAPMMAGAAIIVADPAIFGAVKESAALAKIIHEATTSARTELIRAIGQTIQAGKKLDKQEMPKESTIDATVKMLIKRCHQAALIVQAKSPEEADGFVAFLLDVAQETANASKEGGFLGIGAVRVSEHEKKAIADLAAALGTPPPVEPEMTD